MSQFVQAFRHQPRISDFETTSYNGRLSCFYVAADVSRRIYLVLLRRHYSDAKGRMEVKYIVDKA